MKQRKKGVDSWTAVQAYNFGAKTTSITSQNTVEQIPSSWPRAYSRDVVAPSLGNVTGETYLYLHPISLLNGMELYINGGNIYYSRLVETNMTIMKLFSWF